MILKRATLSIITLALVRPLLPGTETVTAPIDLHNLPLLFVDDAGVASRSGVFRTVHSAHTRAAPVLEGDHPWEGARVYIYGSVYRDNATGQYRMWYQGSPAPEKGARAHVPALRGNGFTSILYATSPDGATWTKPSLNLYAYDGSTTNNIVFDLGSPSVLFDPFEQDASKRYKLLGTYGGKYHAAYSADGLNWKSYPKSAVLNYADTITLAQDPRTGEYLAYHKRPAQIRGVGRRVVWLSRSRDFQTWSEPELVFAPDPEDDSWAEQPGEHTEVYNMSVLTHAGGYLGLPTIFRVYRTRVTNEMQSGQSPIDGPIDVQLASSVDGRTWRRSWPRVSIIPRGLPGTYDGGTLLGVSSTAVEVGDMTCVYYTAINTTHGGPIPPKRITIGRAEWRLNGFVSLDADPAGGRVETVPLRLAAPALVINADASRGQVRVALLEADGRPIPGYSLENNEPLTTDAPRWIAHWHSHTSAPIDRPVRVVVELRRASFFSISAKPE